MNYAHFTVAYGCILVAALLPLLCAGIAKFGMFGKALHEGGYDNVNPRAWLARQSDWRARANGAGANTVEGLPFFMAAVIVAHILQANQTRLDILAFVFVVLRLFYILLYVAGMGTPRTVVWTLALLVNTVIFFIGYR